ncbi:hypothetical protein BDQ12DRAFT_678160 [Crucibulum laeve]|uniref:Uncharacterized protein n=1 Tax=Crucibulum laeve TaxID=68775 RepID=A0A5C3M9Z2_9AGAR|nr:hypothetical protein BDQ12DRAFT_678160 [Crucibulum laeve]
MPLKRKRDQPADTASVSKAPKRDNGKSASETAAAIVANIPSSGSLPPVGTTVGSDMGRCLKDERSRYISTNNTMEHVMYQGDTEASVGTRGVWYLNCTNATAQDLPLCIHLSANTKDELLKAMDKVDELVVADMGSPVAKVDKPGDSSTMSLPHTESASQTETPLIDMGSPEAKTAKPGDFSTLIRHTESASRTESSFVTSSSYEYSKKYLNPTLIQPRCCVMWSGIRSFLHTAKFYVQEAKVIRLMSFYWPC